MSVATIGPDGRLRVPSMTGRPGQPPARLEQTAPGLTTSAVLAGMGAEPQATTPAAPAPSVRPGTASYAVPGAGVNRTAARQSDGDPNPDRLKPRELSPELAGTYYGQMLTTPEVSRPLDYEMRDGRRFVKNDPNAYAGGQNAPRPGEVGSTWVEHYNGAKVNEQDAEKLKALGWTYGQPAPDGFAYNKQGVLENPYTWGENIRDGALSLGAMGATMATGGALSPWASAAVGGGASAANTKLQGGSWTDALIQGGLGAASGGLGASNVSTPLRIAGQAGIGAASGAASGGGVTGALLGAGLGAAQGAEGKPAAPGGPLSTLPGLAGTIAASGEPSASRVAPGATREDGMRSAAEALFGPNDGVNPDPKLPTAASGAQDTGAAPAADTSQWDTDGYGKPAVTAQNFNPKPPNGWDETKWNDPNHQTPKYVWGRITQDDDPNDVEQLLAAYPGATFDGKDKVSGIPGLGTIDIYKGASVGLNEPQWYDMDAAAVEGGGEGDAAMLAALTGSSGGAQAAQPTGDSSSLDGVMQAIQALLARQGQTSQSGYTDALMREMQAVA